MTKIKPMRIKAKIVSEWLKLNYKVNVDDEFNVQGTGRNKEKNNMVFYLIETKNKRGIVLYEDEVQIVYQIKPNNQDVD